MPLILKEDKVQRYGEGWSTGVLQEEEDGAFIYYSDHLEAVEELTNKIKLLVDHIEFMNEKLEQLKDLL